MSALLQHVRELLAHSEWADAVFFHAWAGSDREDAELRERASHWAGTALLFANVLTGRDELPWDAIMKGEVKPPWAGREPRAFEELRDFTRANHQALRSFAETVDEAGLAREVRIPWIPDPPCVIPVKDALVQAAMHTHHHRAQNLTRLRQLGGATKNVDYILWLWKGRPAGRWDS